MGEQSFWKDDVPSQLGHFAWAFATTFLPFVSLWLLFISGPSAAAILVRELLQYPSKRTSTSPFWTRIGGWDTWLDAVFYVLGYVSGVVVGLVLMGLGILPLF